MSTFRIECPNCGAREASEFAFGGETVPFPLGGEGRESADANYERVWLRRNVLGRQNERWFHAAGCRRWVEVERDTHTNELDPSREAEYGR